MDYEDWEEDLRLILWLRAITPEERVQFKIWYENGLSTNLAASRYQEWKN